MFYPSSSPKKLQEHCRISATGEKLEGSLLKSCFDKHVRIDLQVPLTVPNPLPQPPHPCLPFPHFSQEDHPPPST